MSEVMYKASELRRPVRMMRAEGESRKNNDAMRVTVGITNNKDTYGMVLRTQQVGYRLDMFYPFVKMETQKDTEAFYIKPDETTIQVQTEELERALASFGTQDVLIVLSESEIILENEQGSRVVVRNARPRQLTLPISGMETVAQASHMASSVDWDALGHDGIHLPLVQLCNGLYPAIKVTTMGGNTSDRRGVHIRTWPPQPPTFDSFQNVGGDNTAEQTPQPPLGGEYTAEGQAESRVESCINGKMMMTIVGAHADAVSVYETEFDASCAGSHSPLGETVGAIISPDSAKRLRELLLTVISECGDGKGGCLKDVLVWQAGEEMLYVGCDNWLMTINLLDICATDCSEYLDKPGAYVVEVERTALSQKAAGMKLMGETEAYVKLETEHVYLEGENLQHKGERVLVLPCKHYGMQEDIPTRKYRLEPVITMLSAASASQDNKVVKLMADLDDDVLCLQCGEYNLFVM